MHEELKLETTVPLLDEETFMQVQADLQASLRNQEQAASQAQHGLRHEFSDGRVVYAENARDAIRLCPVLGRMALEDPEKVDALLLLAEMDNDDFDFFDETHEQRIEESPTETVVAYRPTAEVVETQAQVAKEVRQHAPLVTHDLSAQIQVDQAAQRIRGEVELVHRQAVITEQSNTKAVSHVTQSAQILIDERPTLITVAEKNMLIETPPEAPSVDVQPISERVAVVRSSIDLAPPIDIAPAAHHKAVENMHVVDRPNDQPEPLLPAKQIDDQVAAPVGIPPRHREVPTETPVQQIEVLQGIKSESDIIVRSPKESVASIVEAITVAKLDVAPEDPGRQEKPTLDAEVYPTQQIFEENLDVVVLRPQEIMERIETSPLDEILADVGRFVSQETTMETDKNLVTAAIEIEEVNTVMQDIQLLLDKIDHAQIDGSSAQTSFDSLLLEDPTIKQELTEKVAKLFQTLGYEQSDDQVRQLLDSYDTVFLKRSLENMCRLANGSRLSKVLTNSSDRQGRISRQLTAYIRQLMAIQQSWQN